MKRAIFGIASIVLCLFLGFSLGAEERSHANPPAIQKAHKWHAMGSSPCAWWVPINRANGDIDVDSTIHGLRSAGFQCGVFVIEGSGKGNSYDSFQKLLEATKDMDIELWVVIIPPSEGADSLPYRSDYVAWSQALARLSLKYRNFRGFNIDDIEQKTFTRNYICSIYAAKEKVNPGLFFMPTVYNLDRAAADRMAGCVDGVWFWWVNLEQYTGLKSFLENSRYAVEGRFPIYGGIYAHSTSWHKEGNPDAHWTPSHRQGSRRPVFPQSLEDVCRYSDGAIIWELSLAPSNPLLAVAKEFLPGGSSPYAGKCGTGASAAKQ